MNKRATPKYKYQNLKDYLIDKIRSGGFDGSGRLDSEPQLCERFSLSRNTIRQAIQELENEGYVYRIHGKGTFIRNATPGQFPQNRIDDLRYGIYGASRHRRTDPRN